jgi:hypothetical protein
MATSTRSKSLNEGAILLPGFAVDSSAVGDLHRVGIPA